MSVTYWINLYNSFLAIRTMGNILRIVYYCLFYRLTLLYYAANWLPRFEEKLTDDRLYKRLYDYLKLVVSVIFTKETIPHSVKD